MLDILERLCKLDGPAGREDKVRDYIISEIKDFCEYKVDAIGNIIAFKKGKEQGKKVMLDAHMDEVGFIVTHINDDGSLSFTTVGGITTEVLVAQRVRINGCTGVISVKPVHLLSDDEAEKMPKQDSLTIDIGACDKEDAMKYVRIGDEGTFDSGYVNLNGDMICAKAVDDRAGCYALIKMIKQDLPYDAYFSFSVQEEVGLRGAKVSAYSIDPDYAIAVETTTAADLLGTPDSQKVTSVGKGASISFMDATTLYDKRLFDCALNVASEKGIPVQVKTKASGGNNVGSIHVTRGGVPAIVISVPCRYLHAANTVASKKDIDSVCKLVYEMYIRMAEDNI